MERMQKRATFNMPTIFIGFLVFPIGRRYNANNYFRKTKVGKCLFSLKRRCPHLLGVVGWLRLRHRPHGQAEVWQRRVLLRPPSSSSPTHVRPHEDVVHERLGGGVDAVSILEPNRRRGGRRRKQGLCFLFKKERNFVFFIFPPGFFNYSPYH